MGKGETGETGRDELSVSFSRGQGVVRGIKVNKDIYARRVQSSFLRKSVSSISLLGQHAKLKLKTGDNLRLGSVMQQMTHTQVIYALQFERYGRLVIFLIM